MSHLNVYFIRHADSYNNGLYQIIRSELGDVSDDVLEKEEAKRREPDCGISSKGERQLELLKEYISNGGWTFANKCRVFSSPMSRCLITASAIASALPGTQTVEVRRNLFETGGCFTYSHDEATNSSVPIGLPGATAAEIEAKYPHFHCEAGMENGWYNRHVMENDEEFDARAMDVANWLWSEAKTLTETATYILVIHGNFMSAVINALSFGAPRKALVLHCNTALSHLQLFTGDRDVCCIQAVNYAPHLDNDEGRMLKIGNDVVGDHWIQEF